MVRQAIKVRTRGGVAPSVIGWHGIYLEVPAEWNLAAVSGDMPQGNLRADGPEDIHVRVRWQRSKKTPDLEKVLDRYLRSLEKASKRRKIGFEVERDFRLPLRREDAKRKTTYFSWKGDAKAIGQIWYCRACGRVTIAQVDGPLKRNLTLIASQVLSTLDDHAVDGVHTWAAYGLSAEIPADFGLAGQPKLLSGYIQLRFERGRTNVTLDRFAMAEIVLKSRTIEEWVVQQYAKVHRPYKLLSEAVEIRGHSGVVVTGSVRDFRDRVKASMGRMFRLKSATEFTQFAWHCPDTNRILSVVALHSKEEAGLAEEIAASFVCHT